jgi:hypothetical protein
VVGLELLIDAVEGEWDGLVLGDAAARLHLLTHANEFAGRALDSLNTTVEFNLDPLVIILLPWLHLNLKHPHYIIIPVQQGHLALTPLLISDRYLLLTLNCQCKASVRPELYRNLPFSTSLTPDSNEYSPTQKPPLCK